MKRTVFVLFIGLASATLWGQDITGQWNGVLKVQGIQLRLVFHVTETATGYSATMDSPDQGATGIPVTAASFENRTLKMTVAGAGIEYEGILGEDGVIAGAFRQMGQSFPLNLSKKAVETAKTVRPQEPAKPYPYREEEVSFENAEAGITLAGTLTLPQKEGSFPAVVLISGSGAQNRDEELMGHKPFLVIADCLTRNGIAVLRFDDRGTAASTGDFKTATSLDFSKDAEAAVKYLQTRKEINRKKIGLIGHSEGGIIAPMLASRSKDVAFIVLLAGTGVRGDRLLLSQQEAIYTASGMSMEAWKELKAFNEKAFEMVVRSTNTEQLKSDLTDYLKQALKEYPDQKPQGMSEEQFIQTSLSQMTSPWMIHFIKYDPVPALEKTKCPVLALNGEKDLQVPAKENLEAIFAALTKGGNRRVTIKEFSGLNHLFQECTTGLPAEYATIEQTFSPAALEEMLQWINVQTR
ncbi:MAG: alpha/beta fold hydrolase [Bacteroidales bacterium]|jgi:dienelactone hydrolase|nr:alpha/beta fold hydrolase [Bacteroidales bacterium]